MGLQQNINSIIHAFLHINTLACPARSTQSEHARALLALINLFPEAAILLVSDGDWALANGSTFFSFYTLVNVDWAGR